MIDSSMIGVIDTIYAASTGQGGWHGALDRIVHFTGYTHASVYPFDRAVLEAQTLTNCLPTTGLWFNHDPETQAVYERDYWAVEPGRHYRLRHPEARVMHDLMYDEDSAPGCAAFYDWAEKAAGLRYFLYGQTDPERPAGVVVCLHRPRSRGPAGNQEIARFRPLLDHMERAVEIERAVGGTLSPEFGSLDALDRRPVGLVLLNGIGRVLLANRAAREIGAAEDALAFRDGEIVALRQGDNAKLQVLIGEALGLPAGASYLAGGTMRFARRSGRRSYVAVAAPLPRRESILTNLQPAVCLAITDPEVDTSPSTAMLRSAFGLTPMEARLVERLAAGDSLAQAATQLGIAASTARAYLNAVFRKTETNRQQDLVRLLVSLPWWLG